MGARQSHDDGGIHFVEGEPFFGDDFALGSETFPAIHPETYLFGDLTDMHYLSHTPGKAPSFPQNMNHSIPLRSLATLHKESLRLVRHARLNEKLDEYHVEFTYDADVPCRITILLLAEEHHDPTRGTMYTCAHKLATIHCTPGWDQPFSFPEAAFDVSAIADQGLAYEPGQLVVPVVVLIDCTTEAILLADDSDVPVPQQHTHATLAALDMGEDRTYQLRVVAQKLNANGLSYLLREVYGMEPRPAGSDDEGECVVCMTDTRDTLVLPCRHLCLCRGCAEVLRFQASRCPICRAPFHSLLQLRAAVETDGQPTAADADEPPSAPAPGFKTASIVAALNPPAESESTTTPAPTPASALSPTPLSTLPTLAASLPALATAAPLAAAAAAAAAPPPAVAASAATGGSASSRPSSTSLGATGPAGSSIPVPTAMPPLMDDDRTRLASLGSHSLSLGSAGHPESPSAAAAPSDEHFVLPGTPLSPRATTPSPPPRIAAPPASTVLDLRSLSLTSPPGDDATIAEMRM